MANKLNYRIYPELKLIIEVGAGIVNVPDAIEFKKTQIEDKEYNNQFNYIVEISELELDTGFEFDFINFVNTIKTDSRFPGERRSAILTSTPKQVVYGTLYENAINELPMEYKIVSTIPSALLWVNLHPQYAQYITAQIEELKKQLKTLSKKNN